jgi:hypothetical protein
MPNSSRTADSGSGEATALIRSIDGPATTASSTIRWVPWHSASTRRAVKARSSA